MIRTAVAAAALMFALPALAQSTAEKTGANAALGVSPSTADFVTKAAISDMFEIQSSELAEQKGDDATKSFATRMVTDHQKTTADLKGLVTGGTVNATLPTALDSAHQKMLDKLQGLEGAKFVKAYDKDQVSGHKDAVSLFQRYAKSGDNADLKAWAGKTLPTLQEHLKMAQGLGK